MSSASVKYKMQRGFSLVTAIFLLVVLAGLGAMMMTFFTAQQQISASDIVGSRADQAARAGVEWSAFQIIQSVAAGGTYAAGCEAGPSPYTVSVALPATLDAFNVNVECSYTPPVSGTVKTGVYAITSTASGVNGATPGSVDYVERVLSAAIWIPEAANPGILWK
jgi:MSHA biogenesis protein MshP